MEQFIAFWNIGSPVLQVGTILLILYFAYNKSYFSEKGKNLALKKDIADLTTKVEEVKSEFAVKQAILQTDLNRALSYQVAYQDEVREALIYFHGILAEWKFSILEINYFLYNKTNAESLREKRKEIAAFYAKAGIARAKVDLLVEDEELEKAAFELHSTTLAFYHWCELKFLDLQQNIEEHAEITETVLRYFKEYDMFEDQIKELAKDEKKLLSTRDELKAVYRQERNAEEAKIYSFEKRFSNLLKTYLKQ